MPQLAQLRFAASVATVQAPSARPSALLPSAHRFAEPRGFKTDRQTDRQTDSKHSLRTLGPHHPPISHVASFLFVSSPPARRHTRTAPSRAPAPVLLPVHDTSYSRLAAYGSNGPPRSRASAEVDSIRSLGSGGTLAAYERRECALVAPWPRQALAPRPMQRPRA